MKAVIQRKATLAVKYYLLIDTELKKLKVERVRLENALGKAREILQENYCRIDFSVEAISKYYTSGSAHNYDIDSIWSYVNELRALSNEAELQISVFNADLRKIQVRLMQLNAQLSRLSEFIKQKEQEYALALMNIEMSEVEDNFLSRGGYKLS